MPAPTAAFHAADGIVSVAVNVQAAFVSDCTGEITDFYYKYGDGPTEEHFPGPNSEGWIARHSWTTPGQYTISLRVVGPGGSDREVKTNYITVTA